MNTAKGPALMKFLLSKALLKVEITDEDQNQIVQLSAASFETMRDIGNLIVEAADNAIEELG